MQRYTRLLAQACKVGVQIHSEAPGFYRLSNGKGYILCSSLPQVSEILDRIEHGANVEWDYRRDMRK